MTLITAETSLGLRLVRRVTQERTQYDERRKVVLATGVRGRQGGAIVHHMLPRGWRLRALTRSPACHAAKELNRQG